MNLDTLNKEQKKAVLYNEGPLLILAGAGSGKTKVLTTKIAYLIEELNIEPSFILAITFTNKAALEMKERVNNMIGSVAKDIQISTFHSFGLKILRENYKALDYANNFVIMDSDDSLTIVKKILKNLNYDPKIYNPKAIRNKISNCKNELISPSDYEKYIASDYEKVVSEVYNKYEEKLKQNNAVDFDDLLLLPIKLFRKYPNILQSYQERYKYILIDEYQDTNEAQYILSKMISAKYQNICVVGDADQAIYGFRGANYKNILNFEKDYPKALSIKLEQNYRSTKTILDAANDVIKNNEKRKEKNLWSTKGEGDKITYYRAYDEKDESHYTAMEIKKLLDEGKDASDIAILYRTNAQSRVIEEELLKQNIPYRIVGGFSFYQRKEIKDLLSYLKFIDNPKDTVSFERMIQTPKRGIGTSSIQKIEEYAIANSINLYQALKEADKISIPKNAKSKIKVFLNRLDPIINGLYCSGVLTKTYMTSMTAKNNELEEDVQVIVPDDQNTLDGLINILDLKTKEKVELKENEICITDKAAELLNVKEGDNVTLVDNDGNEKQVKISNVVENYIYHYVYMSKDTYKNIFGEKYKTNVILTKNVNLTEEQEDKLASDIMANSKVSSLTNISTAIRALDDTMKSLNYVVIILIVSAGLLAFVVLYNLSNVNISERIRELATIKVLGFYDKEVYLYITRETIILTIIGILLGLVRRIFLKLLYHRNM